MAGVPSCPPLPLSCALTHQSPPCYNRSSERNQISYQDSSLGIPTVVFGPGAIEQAHTADEWISIEQLLQATEVLYRFIKNWRPL